MAASRSSWTSDLPSFELDVNHLRRRDRPNELEAVQIVANAVEEPLPASKEDRCEIDLHLVDEPGREVLLRHLRATGQLYVLPSGRSSRLIERVLDTGGDERERVVALKLQWLARMVSDHEHGVVKWRVLPPPALPRARRIPGTGMAPEHVAAHDGGAEVRERFLEHGGACVGLSARLS